MSTCWMSRRRGAATTRSVGSCRSHRRACRRILPLDYTVHEVFNGGGNPYGASYTSDHRVEGPGETTLVVARAQGARLARVAGVIGAARDAGLLTAVPAPVNSSRPA